MSCLVPIFKRELKGYFATPVAYVFIVIFLFLTGLFTFKVGRFFNDGEGQATLAPFFTWHPWLYLFLVSAISMRLWAEERKSGTIELLLTLPTQLTQAVMAKFLAAWVFIGIALALTFPMVCTVYYLGHPDTGVILTGYLGSFLMAGAFLAIGVCMSALTKNQVISFILSVVVSLLLILAGLDVVQDFFNGWSVKVADAVASVSFLTHFISIQRGMIQLNDLIFFLSLIVGWLSASVVILEMNRAR
ncbi:MAG TPA: ABC transporter permease [Candidatus Sumerlaeota bacterium]|nr:ABC transporter permease [Candidatus Sumerlaeota bacterium]HPS01436.1 ABC transporter permease [Candidatus Sumerlaeota bacterium]